MNCFSILLHQLDRNMGAKITDFGVSTVLSTWSASQKRTATVGTYSYSAPEKFKTEYDEKEDIWSLGIVM